MRMEKSFKPELLSTNTKGGIRSDGLADPFLDIETDKDGIRIGRIMSTDCKGMVIIPVELEDGDIEGPIPCSAFVAARKLAKHSSQLTIDCNGVCSLTDGSTTVRPETVGKPLPWRSIVEGERLHTTEIEVTLNPVLLLAIAKAMGSECKIRLKISAGHRPVSLVCGDEAVIALLMPMS